MLSELALFAVFSQTVRLPQPHPPRHTDVILLDVICTIFSTFRHDSCRGIALTPPPSVFYLYLYDLYTISWYRLAGSVGIGDVADIHSPPLMATYLLLNRTRGYVCEKAYWRSGPCGTCYQPFIPRFGETSRALWYLLKRVN